jgi:hypothetical protein
MEYDAALEMVVNALTGDAWDGKANGWPWDYGGNATNSLDSAPVRLYRVFQLP